MRPTHYIFALGLFVVAAYAALRLVGRSRGGGGPDGTLVAGDASAEEPDHRSIQMCDARICAIERDADTLVVSLGPHTQIIDERTTDGTIVSRDVRSDATGQILISTGVPGRLEEVQEFLVECRDAARALSIQATTEAVTLTDGTVTLTTTS